MCVGGGKKNTKKLHAFTIPVSESARNKIQKAEMEANVGKRERKLGHGVSEPPCSEAVSALSLTIKALQLLFILTPVP